MTAVLDHCFSLFQVICGKLLFCATTDVLNEFIVKELLQDIDCDRVLVLAAIRYSIFRFKFHFAEIPECLHEGDR